MSRVPVFILSGFLGSGKTTLLKRMLLASHKKGLKPAILMNELGSTDTDGQIISEGSNDILEKLLDGCICCSKKNEVVSCIENLLIQNPDVVFIELTGVANPEEVVDSITEPQLIDKLYVEKIITILDSENILEYNSILAADKVIVETNRRQIEVADMLVMNKIDLITSSKKEKIEKMIKKHNGSSPIYYTSYSDIDVDSLYVNLKPVKRKTMMIRIGKEKAVHHHHHHNQNSSFSRINTISIPIKQVTSTKVIEKFLKKWQPNLLRAKGYVPIKDQTLLMQSVIKRTTWEATNYEGDYYLVLIGINLDEANIKREWEQCLVVK
ncbi:GTP-binding protein [Anaerobacillus alkaliphilus]|uniref:GTP-binding protein n=1 Tax=Anaerobacillus alkaliphilus TaxID=1548597 RepID=A0A4Q0VXY2_9BACI|nr:GTP-binding protein [Anaerobacillus alkaliphilus]RXJ04623.1 GTP-binding protein [Anaerobacillus alkaliphilus]